MNPLAILKEKLLVKPIVEDRKPVEIVIKETKEKKRKPVKQQTIKEEEEEEEKEEEEEEEEEEKDNPVKKEKKQVVFFETEKDYDREGLFKKLIENKKKTVTIKQSVQISKKEKEEEEKKEEPIISKKAKKIKSIKPLVIEEDEEEFVLQPKTKIAFDEEIENIPIVEPKKKKRYTKKIEKGIAILGPETLVDIGDTDLIKRIPKKAPPVIIKVSNYYMNNREIFVNFINSVFEPYRIELEENKENISCNDIGKTSSNFSLLTHQKIVRDYINLFTPYRGLLLYHGLGSGKTCTSIAIAEGMKDTKRVIIMTPASLRANYIEEIKKCGDLLYKRNQYWEWISTIDNPEALKTISIILNLPQEYIHKHKGAFFINIKKRSNYNDLSDINKKILEDQLNEMIRQKYTFINYNGLRYKRLSEMTNGFTQNIFDNSVVIIDEAHNLISRIVNKLKKEKAIPGEEKRKKKEEEEKEEKKGKESLFGEHTPINLATKLYYMLLRANNARIVLLTGTPVINYPNEFAILFNILRGYIKTWKIPLVVKTKNKIDRDVLREMLIGEKSLDYIDYSPSNKMLTITRNPFGFKNVVKKDTGYQGVNNINKKETGEPVINTEFTTDENFEKKIINILKRNDIDVIPQGIEVSNKKALPDDLDLFLNRYINDADHTLKNVDALKRRIIGLSSFFKSAQESLLPRYNKQLGVDYHIVRIPMSDFQFKIYEGARIEERLTEKSRRAPGPDDLFKDSSSTYRIFSRLFCNFVMPERPTPKTIKMEKSHERAKQEMGLDTVYLKLKEQMKPTLYAILDKIEDEREKGDWEIKINNELRSYVKDLINAQKKGKKVSDKKLMNIIKDVQKVEEIHSKTKKTKKHNEEEIENIGKNLEAFNLEEALLESRPKPDEDEVNQEEQSTIVALLKQSRKEERKQDVDDENEGEIEGDQVLDKIGGDEYKDRLNMAIKHIEDNSDDFLTPEALQIYSPKFLHMLENIQESDNEGLHLVYSQFRTAEGVGIFSLTLEKNGFARFKIKKNHTNVWEIDINEIDEGKPTYALYTGTETSEEKEILRHIYNGEWDDIPDSIGSVLKSKYHNNNMGEVIKVFMITSSGSEGINLRNTRYVHIMEPYWHPVRSEQVIGRARRICSHKDLPKALQTVEVFVYLMIFSENQLKSDEAIELKRKDLSKSVPHLPITSDQYLFEISEIKANLTSQLTDAIKESSFDCYIYSNGKCFNFGDPTNNKFSYLPDYTEQQNDTTVKANKKEIKWVGKTIDINDKKYIYKRLDDNVLELYDMTSYKNALKNPSLQPLKVGTYEINERGERVLKLIS